LSKFAVKRATSPETVEIEGPAGSLELLVDGRQAPRAVAVICHPHPLQQGTMHNKVVHTLARAFHRSGAAAVRFNFRGVGRSAGVYSDGVGERDDVLAAARWARERWPHAELYLGGFSFGAAVALMVAARLEPRGLVTVAPPVERIGADFEPPRCPWLLVHGESDDVVPAAAVRGWLATLEPEPALVMLPGVGHFFHGRLNVLADCVTEFFAPDLGGAEQSMAAPAPAARDSGYEAPRGEPPGSDS
jgi:hypothetical protein